MIAFGKGANQMESREAGVLLFPIKKGQPLDGSHAIARFARFAEPQSLSTY